MKYKLAKRMNDSEPSIIRELLKKSVEPGYISFAGGDPDPSFFPVDVLMDFEHNDAVKNNEFLFQYGISEGDNVLKEEIIKYMADMGVGTSIDGLLITSGAQQAIDLTAKLFIDEGDTIIVENPSYMGAINAFNVFGPKYVGIQTDEDGMNMEHLEEVLINGCKPKFLYTIPDFQNPTGITMSLSKRKRLLELAEEYDFVILEDNPYYKLRFDGHDIPTIKSLDSNGRVVYLGSFSKAVCPGLRIGWVCGDEDLISKYVIVKQSTDINTNELSQLQVASFLKNVNLDDYLSKLNQGYKLKKDAMLNALEKNMPADVSFTRPDGGLFVWVTLPESIDSYDLMNKCLEKKLAIIPGARFYVSDVKTNTIRLSFATMSVDEIRKGVEILSQLIRSY